MATGLSKAMRSGLFPPSSSEADVLTCGAYPIIRGRQRLADFILRDMERILVEWEAFAATRFPCGQHDLTGLARRRETHLEAVATDLSPPDKASSGRQIPRGAPKPMEAPETAAQTPPNCGREAASTSTSWPLEYRVARPHLRECSCPGAPFSERSAEFAATSRFFPVGLQAECRSDPDGDEIRDWFGPKLTPSTAQGAREKS